MQMDTFSLLLGVNAMRSDAEPPSGEVAEVQGSSSLLKMGEPTVESANDAHLHEPHALHVCSLSSSEQ